MHKSLPKRLNSRDSLCSVKTNGAEHADKESDAALFLPTVRQLTAALLAGQFVPYYQPLWDVQRQCWEGVETLVRWQHPTRGIIYPDAFIPITEQNGLILELGALVLRAACQQMANWQQSGLFQGIVAVNVSALQIRQPDFVEQVSSILDDSGLSASALELELTETLALEDTPVLIENLHRCRTMGIRLSIDDFGTGSSSLARLQCCPVTRLKIDKSFVARLPFDTKALNIVTSIISLGHNLNLSLVAEGVENKTQQQLLEQLGCEVLQGYQLARPATASQIEAMWRGIVS
ncbi:putative bifunctional diguanylate cyclase/phosphodiesterase [Rheinheimera sp.]|uniref:putative bifunctional diguanylate cyclase/phosphodiesterase n=1 Tax=Rheinheimera sp. TaxID=1869214 RepID=UPI004048C9BF